MKPVISFAVLAASLLAAHLALAQAPGTPQRAPVAKGRVQLLGADMAGTCKTGDLERAHRLADACEGRKQCSFTPEIEDAAAETCARDSLALWDCGDGKTRYAALGPQNKGQSREIKLECAPDVVADAPPPAAPAEPAPRPAPVATASVQPPKPGQPETVIVEEVQPTPPVFRVQRPPPTALDLSAAGIDREVVRAVCEVWTDPTAPENPTARLNQLHAQIWDRPDHTPGAHSGCGVKTTMPPGAAPVR